jgi:polyphenol oxidase
MYQIPKLSYYKNLIHGFSEVKDGNMGIIFNSVRKNKAEVIRNRTKFLEKLNIDITSCQCLWVVHSNKVIVANPSCSGKSMKDLRFLTKADGLITNKKGLFLFLLIADCMPIIIYDPMKKVVAVVHAGWPGVNVNIAKNAVMQFQKIYKSIPGNLVVGIGPCARADSFVKTNPSQKNNPQWRDFLEKIGEDTYKVDFAGLCKKQFLDLGVRPQNIFDSEVDTIKDKRFFSHVRDTKSGFPDQGRFACVVGLR